MTRGTIAAVAALALAAGLAVPAKAGPYDCSVVYDEFDSFMNKNFLMKPESFVRTVQGKLSRADYNSKQKGALLLSPNRKGMGVAIVHTNKNTRGKFLFTWGGRGDLRGSPLMILNDVTLYGRVLDGASPRKYREIRVSASQTVDLDTGRVTQNESADIWYHAVNANEIYLEAVNGAKLSFPMETLCKR